MRLLAITLLVILGLCSVASGAEPLPPPKAVPQAKAAPVAVTVVVVRPMTLLERARERRMAWHADQVVRLQERQARAMFGYGVFLRVGGCCP